MFFTVDVLASGMRPNVNVILVEEGIGEISINVTNTDQVPSLLVSAIYNLPGDDEDILLLTPPMARVEAGESQLVRFILQLEKPLTTQRLRRVTFEGVPPKDGSNNDVSMTLSQDLPVLISPKGLKQDLEPWKHIKWTLGNGKLIANNQSLYVVRLSLGGELLPSNERFVLPHTYILAGQTVSIEIPASTKAQYVKIHPVNLNGYSVADFTTSID